MSAKTEAKSSGSDRLKWLVVFAILGAIVYGNVAYADSPILYRVIAILAASCAALFVAKSTARGTLVWGVLRESYTEIRRVKWPETKDVKMTTIVVVVLIVVMALLLWAFDSIISLLLSLIL